jgi:hypothetical protein
VYAFGGSIRLDDIPAVEKASEISLSVALLESKVKAINSRKAMDELREGTKEQTALEDISAKRKAFHAVWENAGRDPIISTIETVAKPSAGVVAGGKTPQSPVPAPAAAKAPESKNTRELPPILTKDRFQSKIFLQDASSGEDAHLAAVRRVIDVQEQLEVSKQDPSASERTARLAKELRQMRHLLIPERLGDGFNAQLAARKAATFADDTQENLRRLAQDVFILPHEHASLRKMFPAETSPNFNSDSVDGMLRALDEGRAMASGMAHGLMEAFRANAGALPAGEAEAPKKKTKNDGAKGPSAAGVPALSEEVPLDLREALSLLVCHIPFARARAQYLVEYTNKLLLKEAQADAARAFFPKINEANEHVKQLERRSNALSTAGRRFVAMAAEEQSSVGTFF